MNHNCEIYETQQGFFLLDSDLDYIVDAQILGIVSDMIMIFYFHFTFFIHFFSVVARGLLNFVSITLE